MVYPTQGYTQVPQHYAGPPSAPPMYPQAAPPYQAGYPPPIPNMSQPPYPMEGSKRKCIKT